MTPAINWQIQPGPDDTKRHFSRCRATSDSDLQQFINQSIDHGIAIIPHSSHEHARYLLFSWDCSRCILSIVTTDDDKRLDAPESVQIELQHWQQQGGASAEQSELLQYWVRDYLTTCPEFLHFSLIAVICDGDRGSTRLL